MLPTKIRRRYYLIELCLVLIGSLYAHVCTVQAATYSNSAAAFAWIDPTAHTAVTWTSGAACSTGYASAPVDDDITAQLPLGFTFNFGGVNYTTVQIMSNGRLQFGNGFCGAGTNAPGTQVPRTYPYPYYDANLLRTMKVYGADIDLSAGGSVKYASIGSAPNRQFVVTWINAPEWNAGGGSGANSFFNLQVILKENGDFIFQYGTSNNTSHGNAQIGWELTAADYALIAYPADASTTAGNSSSLVGIGSLTNTAIRFFIPASLAEYRLDENAWSGANTVVNTSSASFYGSPVGAVASTAAGYSCRGASVPLNTTKGTVDAINTNINVSSSMGSVGSISFWYKGTAAWNDGNDRMLLDATANNSASFFFMKRTDGSLRFVLEDSANNVFVSVSGTHNFAANTWHHIAVTWALGASARMIIYLDGGLDKQSNLVTSSALSNQIGTLYVGDNQGKAVSNNPTDNSANGIIDEVRVYNYEIPLTVVDRDYLASHVCGSTLSSFLISTGGAAASTCAAKSVSLTARDVSNATLTNYTGTVSLSTSTSHGNWSKVTASGTLTTGAADTGAASYTFVSADNGTVTLALANAHADDLTFAASDVSAGVSAASSILNFRDNAFVVTPTDTLGYTMVAARPHAMKAELWQKDLSTGNCAIATAYAGNKSLKAWLTRGVDDPGAAAPSINAVALPSLTPAANNLLNVNFTNGTYNFSLVTSDVGKCALNLLDDSRSFATGVDVLGASNTLTARPFGLAFTNIQSTLANPGGAIATDTVFAKAGQTFQATVGAYLWQNTDDVNNDGSPDAGKVITDNGLAAKFAWPVTLTTALNTPAGGVVGSIGGSNPIAQASFSAGAATVANLTYSEVGSMTLSASATAYLNSAGLNASGNSGVIGRFTPNNFTVSYNTPEFATGCAAGAFTYMGKPFNFTVGKAPVMTVSARSASAGTPVTKNYSGAFWKLTNSALSPRAYSTASGTLDLGSLPAATVDPAIVDMGGGAFTSVGSGTGTLTFSLGAGISYQHIAETAPFNAEISVSLNIVDADGIAFGTNPAAFGAAAPGSGVAFSSGKEMRFGRLNLQNAYGSELLDLPINLVAEYAIDLDGVGPSSDLGFVRNAADVCTTVAAANVTVTPNSPLLAGDTTLTVAAPTLVDGSWHTSATGPYSHLSKPVGGKQGSVDLSANLNAAGLGWLQYPWTNTGVFSDPSARAVFGIYQGSQRRIYLRERFN